MLELKKLFESIEIKKGIILKNRIVLPAAGTNYGTEDGFVTQRLIDYYVERAKGGTGLIIVECANPVYPDGKVLKEHPSISDEKYIPMFKRLTDAVHGYETRVVLQFNHAGRRGSSAMTGQQPWAPSAIVPKPGTNYEMPREMTIEEIHWVSKMFADAAYRAKQAGFDGVEFHFAHGYLFSSFISPYTNKRTDEYGGSVEKRMRFPLETVRAAREAVGSDFLLLSRINGDDFVEGGLNLAEGQLTAKMLAENSIDLINVSAGLPESTNPIQDYSMVSERGNWVYIADEIKKAIPNVPVATVHRINRPELAEEILEKTDVDLVCMCRALMADPHLPRKAKEGRLSEITTCIACNVGCFDRLFRNLPIECAVNPAMGRKETLEIKPSKERKKVLVVGGGPGGMTAALVAKQRGHEVTLCEKDNALGGQVRLAIRNRYKREMENLITDLAYKLNKHDVKICLGTEVTPEWLEEKEIDVAVIATGVKHVKPNIPGIEKRNVVRAQNVLRETSIVGTRVVILGAGRIDLETSEVLRDQGPFSREVTVLSRTRRDEIVKSFPYSVGQHLVARLEKSGIRILEEVEVKEITDTGVVCKKNGKNMTIPADTVVYTSNAVPNIELVKYLEEKGIKSYRVGDCVEARGVLEATREGYNIGLEI